MVDSVTTVATDILDRVTAVLCERLHLPVEALDSDMIEAGLMDSADFLDLFLHLEEEFGLAIVADDLILEHFVSRQSITQFVITKSIPTK